MRVKRPSPPASLGTSVITQGKQQHGNQLPYIKSALQVASKKGSKHGFVRRTYKMVNQKVSPPLASCEPEAQGKDHLSKEVYRKSYRT